MGWDSRTDTNDKVSSINEVNARIPREEDKTNFLPFYIVSVGMNVMILNIHWD